jgi:hypothetical protein
MKDLYIPKGSLVTAHQVCKYASGLHVPDLDLTVDTKGKQAHVFIKGKHVVTISPGDWIVVLPSGAITYMTDEDFGEKYEELEVPLDDDEYC